MSLCVPSACCCVQPTPLLPSRTVSGPLHLHHLKTYRRCCPRGVSARFQHVQQRAVAGCLGFTFSYQCCGTSRGKSRSGCFLQLSYSSSISSSQVLMRRNCLDVVCGRLAFRQPFGLVPGSPWVVLQELRGGGCTAGYQSPLGTNPLLIGQQCPTPSCHYGDVQVRWHPWVNISTANGELAAYLQRQLCVLTSSQRRAAGRGGCVATSVSHSLAGSAGAPHPSETTQNQQ